MKVLVVQTAFLGDVILTIPLIRSLKKYLNPSQLHILLRPEAHDVYKNDPDIDKIIVYDKKNTEKGLFNLIRIIKRVKEEKYGIVVSPHRSARSSLISRFSGAERRIGFNRNSLNFLYNTKVRYFSESHEIERNLNLMKPLYDGNVEIRFDLRNSNSDRQKAEELLKSVYEGSGHNIVCMAPGSEWNTKRWPSEYYRKLIKLCRFTNLKVILLGGDKDKGICGEIASGFENVTDLCGKLSINESSEVMKLCRMLVCNDTGAMHIGAASGTKIITIFGPTVPEFGFYPFGVDNKIMQSDIYCRPCSIHGGDKCPEGHFLCMRGITPEDVMDEIRGFLKEDSRSGRE